MATTLTKHDEIVLWLYAQAEEVIASKYGTDYTVHSIILEKPICSGRTPHIVGYVDMAVMASNPKITYDSLLVLFEVKPEIPDFGALLRQLRKYELFGQDSRSFGKIKIIVVSPDTRWADILSEQGFDFLQYEP